MFIIQYIANFVFVNSFLKHIICFICFTYLHSSILEGVYVEYFEKAGYLVYILKAL